MSVVNPRYGQIIHGGAVEDAVTATLQYWFPSHLLELERQYDREANSLQAPRSYTTVNEFDEVRGAQKPAVIVIAPGTVDEPLRQGDGTYTYNWAVGVAVLVTAKDRKSANDLAKLYGAAVRSIVVRNQTLKTPDVTAIASAVELGAETYTDPPADFLEIGSVARVAFVVTVPNVVTDLLGPNEPEDNPSPFPAVQTVDITVSKGDLT